MVNIFTTKSLSREWARQIEDLLDVPVRRNDELPPYICNKCSNRIVSLDKARENLTSFKISARACLDKARQG